MAEALTLILGPQSTGGLLLNQFVREQGKALARAGVRALPLRRAAPLVRRMNDGARPFRDRKAEFLRETAQRPVVLTALNAFGPPDTAFLQGALYPGAEEILNPLGKMAGLCQAVLVIEPLPQFFLAPGVERLEARLRATPWEVLYEQNWVGLARQVLDRMKAASLLVLTPRGMALRSPEVLGRLFGAAAPDLAGPHWLLHQSVTETGQGVLERVLAQKAAPPEMLAEVYDAFARVPSRDDLQARLGIEKITAELLAQRFDEDCATLARLPRVEVI
ncbi:MAG: hypothetical protein OIF48_15050 [Silicimonas sp.]|nr:hypothetical protein [Silicimonas sp.]